MKITNLLENTLASMPDPGQTAFRSGRSETSLEEMTAGGTVAGAVASVSKPMGKMIKRESGITKGIKKKMVDEGELSENDLILVPGQISKRSKGFVSKDRNEMERIEMAKSDVVQSVKSAKSIFNILKTSDDEIEGWVQEKLAKAEDYLNTVREYLEGKNMQAEGMSAGERMQRALQREKEKRERSERYAEKHFPIGKKPEQNTEPQKEVKEAEGPHDWMDDMRAMAHKMAPQDKLRQGQAERQSQQQAEQQKRLQQDIENLPELMSQFREMKSEYESLGGRNWQYADREQNLSDEERKARGMETSLRQLADRIRAAKQSSEGLAEVAPPGAKAERMVKHIKKSYSKDGKITPKEKSIAYATTWKAHNKGKVEEQGVAEGSGQKPTITYKDYTLQYDYQTEDDDPEGYSTATTYYFDVFKDGNRVGEAEYFDYFGDLTIRINGKTKKFEHQHPLASQVSQLVSSLPDEQKRDLSDPKFESQGVAEGSLEEYGDTKKGQKMLTRVQKRAVDRAIKADDKNRSEPDVSKRDLKTVRKNAATADRAWERMSDKDLEEESKGLWANIHAKRERIKHGSGEKMRKPGSKGAPTADALRKSAK